MSNTFIIKPSNDGKTKYTVIYNGKTIKFGAYGMNDFLIYNQKKGMDYANERKRLYLKRHSKNENFNDPYSRAFWAVNILWNKKTLNESIDDVKKKLNII